MMGMAARMGLAVEPLEVMGGGVMEWRRDRDRHLYMHSGFLSPNVVPTSGARRACVCVQWGWCLYGVPQKNSVKG